MITSGQRWYLVQSHPNGEHKAVGHLNRQGFVTYLPRYLKRRRHARRIEMVAAPLFPRYLFVAIDMTLQRWRSIYSTLGVSQLVCAGDRPISVPDEVVAALKRREDDSGCIKLEPRVRFRAGDNVRVLNGAFSDCLGLYEGMPAGERVSILLDLFGRKVRVLVDAEIVAAA